MGFLKGLFGGGIDGITKIAEEWIDTDMESAEAKTLMVKALDPNGKMRRDISSRVSKMYMIYIYLTATLVLAQAFDLGDPVQVKMAIDNLTDLFVPITSMFTLIVGASFGVNGVNSVKEKG
jgi:hypothetical protein